MKELRNNLGFHTATTMVLLAQGPLMALARRAKVSSGCSCSCPVSSLCIELPASPSRKKGPRPTTR